MSTGTLVVLFLDDAVNEEWEYFQAAKVQPTSIA